MPGDYWYPNIAEDLNAILDIDEPEDWTDELYPVGHHVFIVDSSTLCGYWS